MTPNEEASSYRAERDTWFFPSRLNRKQFVIRWLLWVVGFVGIGFLLGFIRAIQPVASVIVLLGGLLYLVVGLARPRLRSAGLSPWFLLLWLVPVANFATAILLFIAPPEKTSKPGGTDNIGTAPRNGAWLKSKKPIAIYAVTALAMAAALFFFPAGRAAHSTAREAKSLSHDQAVGKTQFITVEPGVALEVVDFGGSGRALVLLAGLGASAHEFDRFSAELTRSYRVYAISRRGFGESSVPASGYSADRLGDDALAVMDALKLVRPVLAGHSMAGEELSDLATRYPERVGGVIYLDAGYGYALYDQVHGNLLLDLCPLFRALEALLPNRFLSPAFQIISRQRKFTELHVPVLAFFAVPHDLSLEFKNNPAGRAKAEELDSVRTERQVKAFERQLPTAKVIRLPHARHTIYKSKIAEVVREMNAFIDALPYSGTAPRPEIQSDQPDHAPDPTALAVTPAAPAPVVPPPDAADR
jgi:pimeloyl-ACP methyl ester carboxylesterase/uncharacterized membrane protein YhaH (DUF805 family)